MKQLVASLLLVISLFPQCALAWCDNPETGKSQKFFVAIYTVNGCNPNIKFPDGTDVMEFWPIKNTGDVAGEPQTVRLGDECEWTNERHGLSCTK